MLRALSILLVVLTFATLLLERAIACGGAYRRDATVEVAEETALILWDSTSKVQHFIRRATFHANTPDFGFLVPTPSQPELAEAPQTVFDFLGKLTAPEVVHVTRWEFLPIGCDKSRDEKSAGGVRELDRKRVAGYDAVVLEADSAKELGDWLAKNEYVARKDLADWLDQYVKKKWKITAFKIARDASYSEIGTNAVRMSFPTDKPFFPYSEPADQGHESRTYGPRLRVYFLADGRYDGQLGETDKRWSGKTVWSGPLKEEVANEVTRVGIARPASTTYLTEFEDSTTNRPPSTDVFFQPTSDQTETRRPPIQISETSYFGCWIIVAMPLLLFFALYMVRRRRPASQSQYS